MCSQGVIPPDWGQPGAFPSLQHLNLGGNQLKGELPEIGLGALSKLEVCAYSLHRAKQVDIVQFRIVAQYHAHHNSTGRAARFMMCHADMGTAVEHASWECPRVLAELEGKYCLAEARQLSTLWLQASKR